MFYGDGKGCSKTCTKEPSCLDSSGNTKECTTACGDGNRDANEDCDDGNQVDDDGCSKDCKIETDKGFTCTDKLIADSAFDPDALRSRHGIGPARGDRRIGRRSAPAPRNCGLLPAE